jgi:hypothetical protein
VFESDTRGKPLNGGRNVEQTSPVTALAHKLACILYVMITRREPYRPDLHAATGELHRARTPKRLAAKAKDLGFQLVPTPAAA